MFYSEIVGAWICIAMSECSVYYALIILFDGSTKRVARQ